MTEIRTLPLSEARAHTFIWSEFKDEFVKRMVKMNKRAKKLGVPFVDFEFTEDILVEIGKGGGRKVHYDATLVELKGDPIVIKGWTFIAKIEYAEDKNGKNVLFFDRAPFVPEGLEIPESFRGRTPKECDHCGHRRNRSKAYIVLNEETGEWKLVGSSCLRDFTFGYDPNSVIKLFSRLFSEIAGFSDDPEEFERMGRIRPVFDLAEVISAADRVIRFKGWMPRSAVAEGGGCSTSDWVSWYLHPGLLRDEEERRAWEKFVKDMEEFPADPEKVEKVLSWIEAGGAGKSDYGHNAKTLLSLKWVPMKRLGLAVSLVAVFDKAEVRRIEREEAPGFKVKDSSYIGAFKERLELTVTLLKAITCYGAYGESILHVFADENGNALSWFNSGRSSKMETGKTYRIAGTVKNHENYRGTRTTYLTRVSNLGEVELSNAGAA